jgi:hypothetical protein
MNPLYRRVLGILGAASLVAMLMAVGMTNVAADEKGDKGDKGATCAGGSVAPGTYKSLTITGLCNLDSGNVTVKHDLTVAAGAGLNAAFSGSNLTVGRDLLLRSGGLLILGCEPFAFPCFNDPNGQKGGTVGVQTNHRIGRDFISRGGKLVLLHHSTIGGEVSQTGGGGGLPCVEVFPKGPPPYTTYEDNVIHGDVTVSGLHTCWAGFFRNVVHGDVSWNNNRTWDGTPEPPGNPAVHGDEDGNEITTNTIHGDLNCFNNMPAIQFGDSGGVPNTVSGETRGQCLAVV